MNYYHFIIVLILFYGGKYLYSYYLDRREIIEANESIERNRKNRLKKFYEEHEERKIYDEYDEELFWDLIDNSRTRGRNSYKNQLGLLKDEFSKLTPEELIKMDNLIQRLIDDAKNYDIMAATEIIFKNSSERIFEIFISVLITKGRVFYKNVIINSNILVGKEFAEIIDNTLQDLILELYEIKTNKLLPFIKGHEVKIKGEKWDKRDLPSRYSRLWEEFA